MVRQCLILICLLASFIARAETKQLFPKAIAALSNSQYFSRYVLVADKTSRTLTIWDSTTLTKVEEFPADFGKNEGNKSQRGDFKTPEGIYQLTNQLEGPGLDYNEYGSLAFTLNYPNFFDRRLAKSGGGIWLHAIPETKNLQRGSRGCVVVTNENIKKVRNYIKLGKTPIVVLASLEMVKLEEYQTEKSKWLSWLEKWKNSWEQKKLDDYMKFYGNEFQAQGMNKEKWRAFKESLNQQYESIKVQVFEPVVLSHQDEYVIQFVQNYKSPNHEDTGVKQLFVKKVGNDFQIVGEEWLKDEKAMSVIQVASPVNSTNVVSERN